MNDATETLKAAFQGKWFHSIDFGAGLISPGRFSDGRPQNYTLYGVLHYLDKIDITGKDCLDIGTMDGLIAFTLKKKAANRVLATDMSPRKTFEAGASFLGLDIDYHYPISIAKLPALIGENKLDLIICAGILYHVFEPLSSLIICREQLKEQGLLILETQYIHDENRPLISFNPSENKGNIHANVFFRPSYSALIGMMEIAGFAVISTIATNGRITVLAKAVKPSQIKASTPMIKTICSSYMNYKNYRENIDYRQLNGDNPVSSIAHAVAEGSHYWLHSSLFVTTNPLQPTWKASNREKLKIFLSELVFKLRTCYARKMLLQNL